MNQKDQDTIACEHARIAYVGTQFGDQAALEFVQRTLPLYVNVWKKGFRPDKQKKNQGRGLPMRRSYAASIYVFRSFLKEAREEFCE